MDGKRPVGHQIRRKGVVYTRQLPRLTVNVEFDIPVASRQHPKGWKFAREFDPQGRPYFRNNYEQSEACKRASAAGEPVEYDAWD